MDSKSMTLSVHEKAPGPITTGPDADAIGDAKKSRTGTSVLLVIVTFMTSAAPPADVTATQR